MHDYERLRVLVIEDQDPDHIVCRNLRPYLPGLQEDAGNWTRADNMKSALELIRAMPTDTRGEGFFDIVVIDIRLARGSRDAGDADVFNELAEEAEAAKVSGFDPQATDYEDGGLWLWALTERRFRASPFRPVVVLFTYHQRYVNLLQPMRFAEVVDFFVKTESVEKSLHTAEDAALPGAMSHLYSLVNAGTLKGIGITAETIRAIAERLDVTLRKPSSSPAVSPVDRTVPVSAAFHARLDRYRKGIIATLQTQEFRDALRMAQAREGNTRRCHLTSLGQRTLRGPRNILWPVEKLFPDVDFGATTDVDVEGALTRLAAGLTPLSQRRLLHRLFGRQSPLHSATHHQHVRDAMKNGTLPAVISNAVDAVRATDGLHPDAYNSLICLLGQWGTTEQNCVDEHIEEIWEQFRTAAVDPAVCGAPVLLVTPEGYLHVPAVKQALRVAYGLYQELAAKDKAECTIQSEPNKWCWRACFTKSQAMQDTGWRIERFVDVMRTKLAEGAGATLKQIADSCQGYFDAVLEIHDCDVLPQRSAIELTTGNEAAPWYGLDDFAHGIALTCMLHRPD